ncbi:methyltransferase domain-containing protein [Sporosarcina sp. NPDC096371]|uniref:methyltransferase domain-containing protein n=1 Tax=Sporosarcina sp. NPDC096371 TaxID=3364530 RepID=UPI00382C96CE
MQLTIRATGDNVEVISYLLAKNPNSIYERTHKGHSIRMFYSLFTDTALEMTVFVAPDPLALMDQSSNAYDITHYINDREFAVSSIFITLIRSALGTALNGQPKDEYGKWVNHPFRFEFGFGPVVSELSDEQIRGLFEPLGYEVSIEYGEADYAFQMKTKSTARYLTLTGNVTLQKGLQQLFVLIPVLDNYKHYFIDESEIEKIKRYGKGWLDDHPEREFIVRKALRFKEVYSLMEEPIENSQLEEVSTSKVPLSELRYKKIVDVVSDLPMKKSIIDFGSGEGKLAAKLGFIKGVQEILAVEPSEKESLKAINRFEKVQDKDGFVEPTPMWGSLFYYDERLVDKDVLILCEVIEHIDEERLPKVMKLLLDDYKPRVLIITTPNREYNAVYDMPDAKRHSDHRFEWTRSEFEHWCGERNQSGNYELTFEGIGEFDESYGFPTQMCLFVRKGALE